mgnify:CR=1 FL=1
MTREVPKYPKTNYPVPKKRFDKEIRAFFDEALAQSKSGKPLVDVRSPGEYRGEITHMPEYPQEGVLRGGHVPGAKSMPWKTATNDDATFKPASELAKIYFDQCGVSPGQDTIVYCRIGERSSHTWFVLTYLLWDSITSAITMVRGPNGATKSAHRSKKARNGLRSVVSRCPQREVDDASRSQLAPVR